MFNDVLDVRAADQKRKRALAQVAAKLMANSQRAAGMASIGRPGGGLGRQNAAKFRPLSMSGRGMFGGPGQGLGNGLDNFGIGRFGLVERQPGANDPGAIPGLGGISALDTLGGGGAGSGVGGAPQGGGGGIQAGTPDAYAGQLQNSGLTPEQQQQVGGQFAANNATYGDNGGIASGGYIQADNPVNTGAGGNYGGYVNYQGMMIPAGLYKALMMDQMG